MSNLIGALIGAAIDRQDGDSGIKGALIGAATQSAARVVVPMVATYAVGWLVLYGVRKAWEGVAGENLIAEPGERRG